MKPNLFSTVIFNCVFLGASLPGNGGEKPEAPVPSFDVVGNPIPQVLRGSDCEWIPMRFVKDGNGWRTEPLPENDPMYHAADREIWKRGAVWKEDPSLVPVKWGDDNGNSDAYSVRTRILVDLGGTDGTIMILDDDWRCGQPQNQVWLIRDGLYRLLGIIDLPSGAGCVALEPDPDEWASFQPEYAFRIWSMARGSEGLGSIRCQRIGTNGISRIQAIDIVSRAPGSTISDGIFHAVFHSPPEVPFRIQISETTPDGVVTWRDWANPKERPAESPIPTPPPEPPPPDEWRSSRSFEELLQFLFEFGFRIGESETTDSFWVRTSSGEDDWIVSVSVMPRPSDAVEDEKPRIWRTFVHDASGWRAADGVSDGAYGGVPALFEAFPASSRRLGPDAKMSALVLETASGSEKGSAVRYSLHDSWTAREARFDLRERNRERDAWPASVSDPLAEEIRRNGTAGESGTEARYRIFADLDSDGRDDMLVSEEIRRFEKGGGQFAVYLNRNGTFQKMGTVRLHPNVLSLETAWRWDVFDGKGKIRLWTFSRESPSSGFMRAYRIGQWGVLKEFSFEIFAGPVGTPVGNAVSDAVFGHSEVPFRIQISETTPDGIVTWRDWKNPEN